MTEITLLTRDGVRLNVPCAPGQTVLAAAAAENLHLPAMCGSGNCGQCHAHVSAGGYEMGAYSPVVLPDAAQGGVLLCRCMPHDDLVVELPYDDASISRRAIPEREAVIESITQAGAGAVMLALQLRPDETLGSGADFIPGQYMEFTVPGTEIKRAYSLTNLPNWDGRLEFLMRLVPGGAFSTYLGTQAALGDVLHLRGPMGHFKLDEASPRPRVLVGGGCGAAPLVSLLRHMAEYQEWQPVYLVFGANREEEMLPQALLDELRAGLPQLRIIQAVWHPSQGWGGFSGTSAEALDALLAEGMESPDVYLCGPPKMLNAVRAVAVARGVPAEQIFAEQLAG
jgi:NAD(P)H-flavin reductase/ferredoxin